VHAEVLKKVEKKVLDKAGVVRDAMFRQLSCVGIGPCGKRQHRVTSPRVETFTGDGRGSGDG
jgi:hypothetical protein